MRQSSLAAVAWSLSVGLHMWLFTRAPGQLIPEAQARQKPAEFVMLPAEPEPAAEPDLAPEPEPQEPEPEVQPTPPTLQTVPTPVAATDPPPLPDVVEDEPQESSPAELTGSTLTADLDAAWSAPSGSGRARRGIFRPGVSRPVATPGSSFKKQLAPASKPAALHVVPLSRLSQKPVPPALGAALQKNYPAEARRQGQSGEAKVRARIEANGQVEVATIETETSPGFGRACQKTLEESQWTAPLDQNGRAAATWINYRCKFRIDE